MARFAAAMMFALSLAASGQQSDPGAASYAQSPQHKSKDSAQAKVGGSPTHAAEKAPAAEGRPRAGYEAGTGSAMAGGRTDTGPVGGTSASARQRAAEEDRANAERNAPAQAREGAAQDAKLNRKAGKPAVRMRATAKEKAQAQRRGRIRDREQPRSQSGQ